MSQKRFTNIWHMCRGNDLRASSGKFLRRKVCRPEILDFLGLWFGCLWALSKSWRDTIYTIVALGKLIWQCFNKKPECAGFYSSCSHPTLEREKWGQGLQMPLKVLHDMCGSLSRESSNHLDKTTYAYTDCILHNISRPFSHGTLKQMDWTRWCS